MKEPSEDIESDLPPSPSWKTIISVTVLSMLLLIVVAYLECPILFYRSPYLHFMAQDSAYFVQVAHACDSVLHDHVVTSKNSATLLGDNLPFTVKLSGSDTSLPKILRKLQPECVLVHTNSVGIIILPERIGGFWISWKPNDLTNNQWVLQTGGEIETKTIYTETRP